MLDIDFIRHNPDVVKANTKRRRCDVDIDNVLARDKEIRTLTARIDDLRAERNSSAKKGKPSPEDITKQRTLGETIRKMEESLREKNDEFMRLLSALPNLLSPDVPHGTDDSDNVELRKWGEPKKFDFEPKDHLALGEMHDCIDVTRAAKVSGSRFYYLKNEAVLLRLALMHYGLALFMQEGFTPFFTPHLAHTHTLYGTGYLPFFPNDIWKLEGDEDLSLIGTSEQTLVGYHQDEIMDEESLPRKYIGLSSCFRTEAGSYGKDMRGILRVHEFYKLEQIIFCMPDESAQWHDAALGFEERICRELGIPYRVVIVCDGDCGAPGYKKYDIEGWLPAQGKYRELTSNTNLTDFQTRRLNIRVKMNKKTLYPHTISATGITDRFIISILENYQQADGSIQVPEALLPYMNGIHTINRGSA